jgi:hypothetical protein
MPAALFNGRRNPDQENAMRAECGVPFCDQPDALRMAARGVVNDNGGEVEGYDGGRLLVTMPKDQRARGAIVEGLRAMGLSPDGYWCFPIGTTPVPESLRFGEGYFLSCRFRAAQHSAA